MTEQLIFHAALQLWQHSGTDVEFSHFPLCRFVAIFCLFVLLLFLLFFSYIFPYRHRVYLIVWWIFAVYLLMVSSRKRQDKLEEELFFFVCAQFSLRLSLNAFQFVMYCQWFVAWDLSFPHLTQLNFYWSQ